MRDKNGFEVEPGEDWNDKKSDETIKDKVLILDDFTCKLQII